MGSPRFETHDARACLVTLLWFPPRAMLEPHEHERPTFAVILSGGFDLTYTNRTMRQPRLSCAPGTILMQPAGERHTNCFSDEGARGVVLQPDLASGGLPARCARVLDRIMTFRDARIAESARALAREMDAPDDVTPLVIESLALEMLARAARLDERLGLDGEGEGDPVPPPWLPRAVQFAHDHFRNPIRIADVASAADVPPALLAATFRQFYRVPLGMYVRRLRVDWVTGQLLGTDTPIAVIAAEAGFADQSHLTRTFRRVTGFTPAEFRSTRRLEGRRPAHRGR